MVCHSFCDIPSVRLLGGPVIERRYRDGREHTFNVTG